MIDLTLSSDEEEARSPKRQRVQTQPQTPAERVGSLQAPAQAAAAAAPATAAASAVPWPVGESFGSLGLDGHDADGDWDYSGTRGGVAAAGPGPSSQALAAAAAAAAADGRGGGGKGGNAAGARAGAVVTEGGDRRGGSGRRRAQLGGGGGVDDDDGDWEPEDDHDRRVLAGTTAAAGTAGGGGGGGGAWGGEERDDDDDGGDTEAEEEAAGGAATKKRGQAGAGGRKRLTAEERERAKAEKAEEKERAKAAKAAERERAKAAKEAEKEAKKAAKEATKRAKEADKEDKKYQKEVENALKASMVPRYLRLLLSNTLAAHPLGMAMQTHAPVAREGRHETFEVEVHRGMPLAAAGYRYCMWGMRVPAGAAERLTAVAGGGAGGGGAEGCALEPCGLPDVAGTGKPLLLFPLLALVLLGDELLRHLEADTAAAAAAGAGAAAAAGAAGAGTGAAAAAGAAGAGSGRVGPRGPLSRLYGEVAAAHPGCTLLVYVVGLQEAMSRRQRANKAFPREAVEDLLFDITVGMPAVRLHTDCPDGDWAHAATFLVNYGWALAGAPKKRQAAQPGYLNNFGNKSTIPLRVIKDVLRDRAAAAAAADDDDEAESLVPALVLCDALSHLVVPQSAAAVAAEYGSLGAIIEALKARPDARSRERLLENCPIPGAVAGKQRLTRAGPAAAASLARFLTIHNGRDVWVEAGLE
ncbi:hypothetical protein CHLRE_03g165850v5 [Chlamydomonas reinhardtii]|uniref:Uncharacterized protein n=1 Tax=Chlamydomonas reinhardtii TaxID=3055 RepID=A0A2K3DWR2_CHLRE|nr:uncharacterized protein CHLRE_03g165850v5 [Chlamydomonas reinhardtii]PNW84962.1 hypothetical protein CHLRE_03g165850v5 [Chlamydomonas reinhardtii]